MPDGLGPNTVDWSTLDETALRNNEVEAGDGSGGAEEEAAEEIKKPINTELVWFQFAPCSEPETTETTTSTETKETEKKVAAPEQFCSDRVDIYHYFVNHPLKLRYMLKDDQ